MGCVYIAKNKINGKRYIGRTVSTMQRRRSGHEAAARCGNTYPLHAAIRKYGTDSFEWRVYCRYDDLNVLNEVEVFLIKKHQTQSASFGYNITDGGGGTAGWKPTADTLRKRSTALRGKKRTTEQREKTSAAIRALWASAEYREKITAGHKARHPASEETRAKLRESSKRMWRDPEYRRRYAATRRLAAELKAAGRPPKPPRKSLAGRTFEEIYGDRAAEQKAKRSHNSSETRAKLSAAAKRRWADPAKLATARLSYEERYGAERAAEIKAKQSASVRALKKLSATSRTLPA